MRLLGVTLALCLVGVAVSVPTAKQMRQLAGEKAVKQAEDCEAYPCVVFEDQFNSFDFSKWEHEITAGGGGNWEFQYYTNNRSNSYVRDGHLFIKPTLTEDKYGAGFVTSGVLNIWGHQPHNLCTGQAWWGCERAGTPDNAINPVASARLRTSNSFFFNYGRIDVVARMPKGDWLWPAIWMLPRYNEYGDWPASGEIDIVESRGNLDYKDEGGEDRGYTHAGQTLHWGPYLPYNGYYLTTGSKDDATFGDAMHTYSVIWDDEQMQFLIDDEEVFTADPGESGFWDYGDFGLPEETNPWVGGGKMAPFDKPFYIILNVAAGGTNGYFPDSWTNAAYPKPWSNESPTGPRDFWNAVDLWYPTWEGESAAMEIDSVVVYKLQEDP